MRRDRDLKLLMMVVAHFYRYGDPWCERLLVAIRAALDGNTKRHYTEEVISAGLLTTLFRTRLGPPNFFSPRFPNSSSELLSPSMMPYSWTRGR